MINHTTKQISAVWNRKTPLRQITAEQLRYLGAHQVAYVRIGACDGELGFLLFDADGTPLGIASTTDALVDAAAERGLSVVAIH
jgi:hypothetical protein